VGHYPGVVEERVQATQYLDRLKYGGLHLGVIRDVRHDRDTFSTRVTDQLNRLTDSVARDI
jgi:hypothetical protein